jgi:general secretion pathway protein A
MYDEHYGLTGRPFQLTPDPRFWFDTATHKKAMAYLGYGLAQGEGFIVITGDIGAGKTTLVGHLMQTIDPARLHAIRIVSSQIEADDLLRLVADGLQVAHAGLSKAQLLAAIERGLHAVARTGRRTLLIVDEAQALAVTALEELRMLSNFQAGGHAILQIFLLGQPEFRERLHGTEALEQLRQRVIAMHHLDPMSAEEVEPYMIHRLKLVGWQGRPDFSAAAIDALYTASAGVPRRLNILAGRVMLQAAMDGTDLIDGELVEAVVADLGAETPVAKAAAPAMQPAHVDDVPLPMTSAPHASAEPRPILREVAPEPAVAPLIAELETRIAALESRLEQQDEALRRVLTLLVDWVEGESRADAATVRQAAG